MQDTTQECKAPTFCSATKRWKSSSSCRFNAAFRSCSAYSKPRCKHPTGVYGEEGGGRGIRLPDFADIDPPSLQPQEFRGQLWHPSLQCTPSDPCEGEAASLVRQHPLKDHRSKQPCCTLSGMWYGKGVWVHGKKTGLERVRASLEVPTCSSYVRITWCSWSCSTLATRLSDPRRFTLIVLWFFLSSPARAKRQSKDQLGERRKNVDCRVNNNLSLVPQDSHSSPWSDLANAASS